MSSVQPASAPAGGTPAEGTPAGGTTAGGTTAGGTKDPPSSELYNQLKQAMLAAMDLGQIALNVGQLKRVTDAGPGSNYYPEMIVFISISLFLEAAIAGMLLYISIFEVQGQHSKRMKYATMVFVTVLTIFNVVIGIYAGSK